MAISIGVTVLEPRAIDGTASMLDVMPSRRAMSITGSIPTWKIIWAKIEFRDHRMASDTVLARLTGLRVPPPGDQFHSG